MERNLVTNGKRSLRKTNNKKSFSFQPWTLRLVFYLDGRWRIRVKRNRISLIVLIKSIVKEIFLPLFSINETFFVINRGLRVTINGSSGFAIIPLVGRLLPGKKLAGIWKVSSSPWKFLAPLSCSEVVWPSRNKGVRSKVHECRNILGRVTPCHAISRQVTWNGMLWLRELISRLTDLSLLRLHTATSHESQHN